MRQYLGFVLICICLLAFFSRTHAEVNMEQERDKFHDDVKALLHPDIKAPAKLDALGKPTRLQPVSAKVSAFGLADAATFGAVLEAAKMVQNLLRNFTVDLGVEAKGAIGAASEQLSINISELEPLVKKNLRDPIDSLGYDIQNLARQLKNTTTQINDMLDLQRRCASQDVNVFAASLKTLVSQLKNNTLLAKKDEPYLSTFQFTDHYNSIVPVTGGFVEVSGFDLWPQEGKIPVVKIMSQDRLKTYQEMTPLRLDKDKFKFVFDKDDVADHAGECLDVHIVTKRSEGFFGKTKEYSLFMPMCVPSDVSASYFVTSKANYKCPKAPERRKIKSEVFHDTNNICENKKGFHEARVLSVDDNCTIVEVALTPGDLNRNATAQRTFTEKSITIDGSMEEASCLCALGVCTKKLSHSCLNYVATPTVSCKGEEPKHPTAKSRNVKFGAEKQITITNHLDRSCDFEKSDVEFNVFEVLPGDSPQLLHKSGSFQFGNKGGSFASATMRNVGIAASYNPSVTGKFADLTVVLTKQTCGY